MNGTRGDGFYVRSPFGIWSQWVSGMFIGHIRSCSGYGDSSDEASQRICGVDLCSAEKCPRFGTGESKEFPPLKILTAKTVGTYISKNKNIYVDEDEPVVEKPAEKKKPVSKKRPAPTVDTPVVKRKRTTGKATPAATSLALVTVAQEVVPIQMISAVTPPAPKRKEPKKRLQLPAGSDDEIVEKEPAVESVVEQQREKTTAMKWIKLLIKLFLKQR
ncbi:hypothetical protein F511_06125 [Dorcoceras hygrometricum]|uniref:Uncharacterized protein n=1 Tax=Dorcoceras hygrometricum TaxID=472368 RepID=A0A2Z7BLN0_9LAMI|nr:hypothetical protein F511_06125 [Dorcoceras hygrometricum]